MKVLIRGKPMDEEKIKGVEYVKGSILEKEALLGAAEGGLDGIFHLAGVVIHSRYFPEEVYKTNVEGTMNVMEVAKVAKFV